MYIHTHVYIDRREKEKNMREGGKEKGKEAGKGKRENGCGNTAHLRSRKALYNARLYWPSG